jgi:hypothetical protein
MNSTAYNQRIVIYAKDVMYITGREKRASYRLLKRIRQHFSLPPEAFVTIDHFCQYTRINEERVKAFLK